MSLRIVLLAVAVLVANTTISAAQSLPNYGPNAPADADSFGQPPTGTQPPGVSRLGYPPYPYPYRRYWHYRRYHRYHHYRHWYYRH